MPKSQQFQSLTGEIKSASESCYRIEKWPVTCNISRQWLSTHPRVRARMISTSLLLTLSAMDSRFSSTRPPKRIAEHGEKLLMDSIQADLSEMIIKNLLILTRGKSTYIWVSLNPETSRLTPRTMSELKAVVQAIQWHANTFWGIDGEADQQFELSKIDIAVDLGGSFITQ